MEPYTFFLASSLEKVFPDQKPDALAEGAVCTAWRGTRAGVQLVFHSQAGAAACRFKVAVSGAPQMPRMRQVECLPSDFPCYERRDENYLRDQPGLYPDLLWPLEADEIEPLPRQYRSLWLTFDVPKDARQGDYPVQVTVVAVEDHVAPNGARVKRPEGAQRACVLHFTLRVPRASLPPQKLLHTEWFHADCLAQYYGVEAYSEAHWRIVERFIKAAAEEHGINVLLTPVFTPPLDTAVGHERLCVQLVDIELEEGAYRFDFSKLARWADICRRNGVDTLEISHLFTQWGAAATPNIYVREQGALRRKFGWDVSAGSPLYRAFLEAFLPALRQYLTGLGYDDEHVIYHISDEPSAGHSGQYRAARAQAADLLQGCRIMDALSDIGFYREGLVDHPVVAVDHIEPFVEAGVPGLWAYYCCGQCKDVPNRFYAMPSSRNRMMGVLLYLYRIEGFLHWGYNFYNAQYSLQPIDPYRVTHARYAFPSGDPYLVYPGPDGEPLSSIRAEVQADALFDLRALEQLESLAGRAFVEEMICGLCGMRRLTFDDYPKDPAFLLNLRERVAAEIDARCDQ